MLTPITILSAKDVQFLQPHRSMRWAQRQLENARLTVGAKITVVRHLADFWGVEVDELISQLRPCFNPAKG